MSTRKGKVVQFWRTFEHFHLARDFVKTLVQCLKQTEDLTWFTFRRPSGESSNLSSQSGESQCFCIWVKRHEISILLTSINRTEA